MKQKHASCNAGAVTDIYSRYGNICVKAQPQGCVVAALVQKNWIGLGPNLLFPSNWYPVAYCFSPWKFHLVTIATDRPSLSNLLWKLPKSQIRHYCTKHVAFVAICFFSKECQVGAEMAPKLLWRKQTLVFCPCSVHTLCAIYIFFNLSIRS